MIDSVLSFLSEFQTADELADVCRRHCVTGTTEWTDRCVVANLVKFVFPDATDVEVMPCTHGRGLLTIADSARRLPLAANQLALDFDDGLYWDLIEPDDEDDDDDDDTDSWEEDVEHGGEALLEVVA